MPKILVSQLVTVMLKNRLRGLLGGLELACSGQVACITQTVQVTVIV